MNRVASVLAVPFCGLLLVACNFGPVEVITDEEETFDGISEISVQGGTLEVSYVGAESTTQVTLSAYLESNDPVSDGIVFKRKGDRLEVFLPVTDSPFSFWTGRTKGYVHLTGPKDIKLDLKGSSGVLDVAHIRGDSFDFSISSGRMELTDVTCETLKIACSSGKLEASKINGNVDLRLSSGLAVLKNVEGDVYFKGSSGSVSIKEVSGRVSGVMSSGKATVDKVQEIGNLSVSSGYMRLADVSLGSETHLSVASGMMKVSINHSLSNYNYDFTVGSGYLSIGEQSGSKDVRIDNGSSYTIKGNVQSGKLELDAP
ncbi:MAG: DUF4097 family beta strand repeat protein [Lunatimonas sp.]|uniref:DUF4097 family beta strand repeat-containing protein n=1 Tax=Lunatimonas sp. TaxID=2060141 RepID=UPI00263B581A|nr:DUF4097 family beta strand repeat-containing protein [Lunatimonas sp.]MCC5939574.1 DUF4097 family beta strand repeat protein [Lunatimonas sp.]